ncbi:hypothetical protein NKH77_25780 [Streptomyces sp. M19]
MVTAVSAVLCAALFLAGRADGTDGTVTAEGAGRLFVAAFDTVFTGYSVWCLAVFIPPVCGHARGCRRPAAHRPAPDRGERGGRPAVGGVGSARSWTWRARAAVRRPGDGLGHPVRRVPGARRTGRDRGQVGAAPGRWMRAYRDYRALQPCGRRCTPSPPAPP